MEDTATVDTGTVQETQSTETESAATDAQATQAATPASTPSVKELLKREKEDPNVQFTDAELDALEKHWDKSEKPKTKAAEPKKEEVEDNEADKPAEKPKTKTEKEPKEEPEADEDSDPDEGDMEPEAKAILKEVGAKNLKEAAQKIKDLRKLVGGKDAQAVAQITRERDELISSGKSLWASLKANDAQAIAFAEKTFGVKFAGSGSQSSQARLQAVSQGDRFIDPDKFIDAESADLVEAAFRRQAEHIQKLESRFGTIEQERDRQIHEATKEKSIGNIVDEMAEIADRMPELKSISGFREAARNVLNGKSDPRLAVFEELFDIAASIKGATLKDAYDIKRGRDSHRIEKVARQQGLKEAYEQKPNPSLSGRTGGKGEASYQPVTEADLERWESDHNTHPEHWYDKDGNLVQSKIPKKAWKIFDFK
jgi:hypothetical protein